MTEPELESGAVLFPCGLNPCTATANRRQPTHLGTGEQRMGGAYPWQSWRRQAGLPTQAKRVFYNLPLSVWFLVTRPQRGYISWSTLCLTISAVGGTSDPTHGCSFGGSARFRWENGGCTSRHHTNLAPQCRRVVVSGWRMWTCQNLTSAESQMQQFCTAGLECRCSA